MKNGPINLEQVSISNEKGILPEAEVIMTEVEALMPEIDVTTLEESVLVALGEPTTSVKHYGDKIHQEILKKKSASSVLKQNNATNVLRKAPIQKSGNVRAPPRSNRLRPYKKKGGGSK